MSAAPAAARACAAVGPRPSTSAPSTAATAASAFLATTGRVSLAVRTAVRVVTVPRTRRLRPSALAVTASAADPRNRTRLATRLVTLPRRVDIYFEGQPMRRILWTAISFAVGFYAANTVSLSFGALSINDVVAAALTVAFYEGVTAIYYRAARKTLRLLFLNSFKLGVVVALIADAFKLAG